MVATLTCSVLSGAGIRATAVILFSVPCSQVTSSFDKGALQASLAARAGNGITASQVSIALRCTPVPAQDALAAGGLTPRRLQTTDGALLLVGLVVQPFHAWQYHCQCILQSMVDAQYGQRKRVGEGLRCTSAVSAEELGACPLTEQ